MSDKIMNYYLNIWDHKPEKEQRKILLKLLIRNNFSEEKSRELLDAYYGTYRTRESFMAEYVANKLDVCVEILRYINFEQMAFDYFANDFFSLHYDYVEHIFVRI